VFGIATNRHWKDNNGNDKEEVCFAECESWGKRGETVSKYFTKGSPIFIDGRLKFEQWQANDGSKRSRLKIVVENFEFVSGQTKENTENTPPYSDQPDAGGFSGDDIPF
jgi:single-strand DNA-binding protein